MISFSWLKRPCGPSVVFRYISRPYSAASRGSTGARMVIKRITMFKVPKDEDIQAVLEAYDVLGKTATKVRSLFWL